MKSETPQADVNSPTVDNSKWRLKYATFVGGEVYSVAQFFPVRNTRGANTLTGLYIDTGFQNTINYLSASEMNANRFNMAGLLIKVGGTDGVTQDKLDEQNYLGTPPSEVQTTFRYDFSPNANFIDTNSVTNYYFGGQWLNFCLAFPQFTYNVSTDVEPNRYFGVADVFTQYFFAAVSNYFRADNQQKLIGGYKNSKFVIRGDAFNTDFVNISKNDLTKLNNVHLKGLNIRKWNLNAESISNNTNIIISAKGLKYLNPSSIPTSQAIWNQAGWDAYYSGYGTIPAGEPVTAFIFKGTYDSDCVQMLADFNVI